MTDIVETLRKQARDIAKQGVNGWGNTMQFAADEIEALRAKLDTQLPAATKCIVCNGESELFEMAPIKTQSGRRIHRLKEGFSKRDNPTYFRCRLKDAAPGASGEG